MKFVKDERPSSFACETVFRVWLERLGGRVVLSAGAPGMEDHETFGSDRRAVDRARELAAEWGVTWCETCGSWHAGEGWRGMLAVDAPPAPRMEMRMEARPRVVRCACGAFAIGNAAYRAGHGVDNCDELRS